VVRWQMLKGLTPDSTIAVYLKIYGFDLLTLPYLQITEEFLPIA
jgi:hypothetical protein